MKSIKKYLITLFIGFAVVALIVWSKNIFSQTVIANIFHILCDSFFAVGVFILGMGLLVFASNEGTFDGLIYGVNAFINIFRKRSAKKFETFYDYKASKADNKSSFGFMIICGLFFLAVALVMLLFYHKYS